MRLADHRRIAAAAHAGDPHHVHGDDAFLRRLLGGRAAFLRHGTARAFSTADACAVAFRDPRLDQRRGIATGSIGYFEARTPQAGREILERCCSWLRDQGAAEVWAPFAGNSFYGAGLREDSFNRPAVTGCPDQPAWYADIFAAAGFTRVGGYANFSVDLAKRSWLGHTEVPGIVFQKASRLHFRRDVERFIAIHNRAFAGVWGESELSGAEAWELIGRARLAMVPELFQFAVLDGRDVGVVLAYPDINEAVAPMRQPFTSLRGVMRVLLRRKQVRSAVLMAVGVLPEAQGRGLGRALVARACEAAAARGLSNLEYALVAEGNAASEATVARLGGVPSRRFGVHARTL